MKAQTINIICLGLVVGSVLMTGGIKYLTRPSEAEIHTTLKTNWIEVATVPWDQQEGWEQVLQIQCVTSNRWVFSEFLERKYEISSATHLPPGFSLEPRPRTTPTGGVVNLHRIFSDKP